MNSSPLLIGSVAQEEASVLPHLRAMAVPASTVPLSSSPPKASMQAAQILGRMQNSPSTSRQNESQTLEVKGRAFEDLRAVFKVGTNSKNIFIKDGEQTRLLQRRVLCFSEPIVR